MSLQLTDRQRNTIAAALTVIAVGVILLATGVLIYLIGAFFNKFSNVFLPVAVAGVMALVFNPYYEWLCNRLRMPRIVALAFLFLSLLLPFVGIGWFFGSKLTAQIGELISNLPGYWTSSVEWVRQHLPQVQEFFDDHPIGQQIRKTMAEGDGTEGVWSGFKIFGDKALLAGGALLRGIGSLLNWAVLPVYLAFFLMARRADDFDPHELLPFLKQETREDVVYLVTEFVNIIVSFFRGQLLIALLQGILFAIGFEIVSLKYGLVFGLLLGFLNIIPYLGSIVGLGICLPLAFFQDGGGLWATVGVMIVFVTVQMIEGYLLTPKIMGDRTGLHPMVIMIAIFFWGSALGGITGMILAIPLTAFLVVFWRLAREKYIHELV